jgi:tRNA1Val (adenine37-N6)-methyltransferase
VHKPFRLPEIISVMKAYKIEPKQMRLVHPYVDKEPTMVLIGGVRGGKPELRVAPPLVLYREKGIYTDEVQTIYHPK